MPLAARALQVLLLMLALAPPCTAAPPASPAPSPPGFPPRPGPIERRFIELSRTANGIERGDPDAAYAFVDSLVRVSRGRDPLTETGARLWRARQMSRTYRVSEARPLFDSVATVARAMRDTCILARVYASLGHGAQINGQPEEAKRNFRRALEYCRTTQSVALEGFVRRGLGAFAKNEGRYDEALREFSRVLQSVDVKTFEHLHSRMMIAEVMIRLNRTDEARVRLDSVLTEARRRGDSWSIAASLQDLGNIAFEQGDMAAADRQWEYAAAVYDTTGNLPGAISVRTNRAHALAFLGRHDEALRLLERLIEDGRKIEDPVPRIATEGELGHLLRQMGHTARAERVLRSVRRAARGVDVKAEAYASLELAALLTASGRPLESEALIDSVLAPARGVAVTPDDAAAAWLERAVARRARHRPAEALAAAREAERLARRVSTRASINWLDTVIEVGRCQRATGRPDEAVAVLTRGAREWERWRASISDLEWRERAGSGLASLFAEYGLALLDPRRRLAASERDAQAFDALQAFQARTLEERMHGQGLSARAMTRRVTADSLRRHVLREGELLVDLIATPDTTFVFLLTRAGVQSRVLPGTRRLDALFEDWRQATLSGADAAMVEAGLRRLSTELLGPIAEPLRGSRRIVVSGGGSLALWPIGALSLPGESARLGDGREIVSTPSATLFALLRGRTGALPREPRLLAVSRTTDARGRDLPGAERELRLLGSGFTGVTVRQNRGDRTVADLTSDLAGWDAMHFAAHSEAEAGSPWRSGFLLGRDNEPDAYLRASTVAGLQLHAELAVLSGCQSAGAATLAGEGALGLSAGFLCAGTRSVVATLWPVSDRTAERFVSAFYGALAEGHSVAAAVREARLVLRGRAETANPRDWAAFVALGEPATVLPIRRKS